MASGQSGDDDNNSCDRNQSRKTHWVTFEDGRVSDDDDNDYDHDDDDVGDGDGRCLRSGAGSRHDDDMSDTGNECDRDESNGDARATT